MALKFTANIRLANDAMRTPTDLAKALEQLAAQMRQYTAGDPSWPITMTASTRIAGNVIDENGNMVGSWSIKRGA